MDSKNNNKFMESLVKSGVGEDDRRAKRVLFFVALFVLIYSALFTMLCVDVFIAAGVTKHYTNFYFSLFVTSLCYACSGLLFYLSKSK